MGAGITITLISTLTLAEAEHRQPLEDSTPLGDGVLLLYVTGSSGGEVQTQLQAIENAKLIKIGDRYFIRGKGIIMKGSNDFDKYQMLDGADVAYDWRYITRFYDVPRDVFEAHVNALTSEE
jgi:hypothetical protein